MLRAGSKPITNPPANSTCGWRRTRRHPALTSYRRIEGETWIGSLHSEPCWGAEPPPPHGSVTGERKGRFRVRRPFLCAPKLRTAEVEFQRRLRHLRLSLWFQLQTRQMKALVHIQNKTIRFMRNYRSVMEILIIFLIFYISLYPRISSNSWECDRLPIVSS